MTPDGREDSVVLEPATISDFSELLYLDSLCFGRLAWGPQAWEEALTDPAWTTVMWRPDEHVRGAMVVFAARPESSLASIAVHPAYRRRGVGRSLLREALLRARNASALWISLEVDRDNATAVALYRRAGFRVHRRFSEDGRSRMEMRRRLGRRDRSGAGAAVTTAKVSLL